MYQIVILQQTNLRELREAPKVNKYKTKLCQKYWVTGYCAYGPRCNFIHQDPPGCEQKQQQQQQQQQQQISLAQRIGGRRFDRDLGGDSIEKISA